MKNLKTITTARLVELAEESRGKAIQTDNPALLAELKRRGLNPRTYSKSLRAIKGVMTQKY